MYQIIFTPNARKDLKKLPSGVQDYIENICLRQLGDSPYQYGISLRGVFREYWKYTFTYAGVHYRIVYQISRTDLFVFLIKIGTRENFYKELQRRVKPRHAPILTALMFLAVLAASLALGPGVARGKDEQEKNSSEPEKTGDETIPPNLFQIQAGRFGLNEVAKLLGLIEEKKDCYHPETINGVQVQKCRAPDLRAVVLKLIQVALGFTSLLVLIFVLYGGFTWTTAAGNAERVDKGRKILIWAGAGLVAVLLAWSVVTYVLYTASRIAA